jgi:RNA polymerase sigma-70 factor (ECF subfamily)
MTDGIGWFMQGNGKDTDEIIVQSILSGSIDSYRILVDRYDRKLSRYVRSIVGSSPDLDDIVQTVFIKAYTNLPAFRRTLSFSSWIYRIAHNEAVNHVKSSIFRNVFAMGDWFDMGKNDETEAEMDRGLLKQQLDSCLEHLDIKYREPMALYYLEDKSYEDISDILRIPVRAVGVRIYRAKKYMRRLCHEKITH